MTCLFYLSIRIVCSELYNIVDFNSFLRCMAIHKQLVLFTYCCIFAAVASALLRSLCPLTMKAASDADTREEPVFVATCRFVLW